MRLALIELVRRPGRFAVAAGALTVLTLLLLFLGALLDGLYLGSTGALRAQPDGVIVFSADARESLFRSSTTQDDRDRIMAIDLVDQAGGFGVTLLGVDVSGSTGIVDGAIIGYDLASEAIPAPPREDHAWADQRLEAAGVAIGDVVLVGPAAVPLTIDGWVTDANFLGQDGLWVSLPTWRTVQNANRPDLRLADTEYQSIVAVPVPGADLSSLAATIDAATGSSTQTLTREQATDALPGVREQGTTFNAIIGTTFVVVGLVVSLFFALLTLERVGLYSVLKAFGTPGRTLVAGVVVQAAAVAVISFLAGATLTWALASSVPADIPVQLTIDRAVSTSIGITFTAVAGGLVSLRRIMSIDPAAAIGAGL